MFSQRGTLSGSMILSVEFVGHSTITSIKCPLRTTTLNWPVEVSEYQGLRENTKHQW